MYNFLWHEVLGQCLKLFDHPEILQAYYPLINLYGAETIIIQDNYVDDNTMAMMPWLFCRQATTSHGIDCIIKAILYIP